MLTELLGIFTSSFQQPNELLVQTVILDLEDNFADFLILFGLAVYSSVFRLKFDAMLMQLALQLLTTFAIQWHDVLTRCRQRHKLKMSFKY
jgi:hypothetical protein